MHAIQAVDKTPTVGCDSNPSQQDVSHAYTVIKYQRDTNRLKARNAENVRH